MNLDRTLKLECAIVASNRCLLQFYAIRLYGRKLQDERVFVVVDNSAQEVFGC